MKKHMTNKRKLEILGELIDWIGDHDQEFIDCAMNATSVTREEAKELGIELGDCYEGDE